MRVRRTRSIARPALLVVIGCAILGWSFGCASPYRTSSSAAAGANQNWAPLASETVLIDTRPKSRSAGSFVTGEREVVLRAKDGKAVGRFFFRPLDGAADDIWQPIATRSADGASARFRAPKVGAYAFTIAPFGAKRVPYDRVRIAFDWESPTVQVLEALPAEPFEPGDRIELHYQVDDAFASSSEVALEMSEGVDGAWSEVTDLPAQGPASWICPHRQLAGAKLRLRVTDLAGNATAVIVPGTLTISGTAPRVTVAADLTFTSTSTPIPYTVVSEGAAPGIHRVELWITQDDGETWNLHAYDHDLRPPFEVSLPEGVIGCEVVIIDADGYRGPTPVPGNAPSARVLVDRTKPSVVWGEAKAEKLPAGSFGAPQIEIRIPYRVEDLAVDPASLLVTETSTGSYTAEIVGPDGASGHLVVRRPIDAPDPLLIEMTGADVAGNRFANELRVHPQDLLDPPTIELTDAPRGWVRVGDSVPVAFAVDWRSTGPTPVRLEWTSGDGLWKVIAKDLPPTGRHDWVVPAIDADDVRVRVVATSKDGREIHDEVDEPFGIDSEAPSVRIVGPSSGYGDPVSVHIEGADGAGSGITEIELHSRRLGSERWELESSRRASAGGFDFRPRAKGSYELWAVATDAAGNRSRAPELAPDGEAFVFEASDVATGIQLLTFQDGGVYAGGTRHWIAFRWNGPKPIGGMIEVEYSVDDGASWRPIQAIPIRARELTWQLPRGDVETARVRVTAKPFGGRVHRDQSRTAFSIDSTAPRVRITKVEPRPGNRARIHYSADDGPAGQLSQIVLYTSRDAGQRWDRHGENFAAGLPFIDVELPTGEYAFALVGIDKAQNEGAAPGPGSTALATTYEIGSPRGADLSLTMPHSGVFPGGSRHYAFWKLSEVGVGFPDFPVRLEYQVEGDESWSEIGRNLPAEGRRAWTVPDEDGKRIKLRVTAQDLAGRVYTSASKDWLAVDSSIPQITVEGPESTRKSPVEIEYRIDGEDAEMDSVEVYARAVSTPKWELVGRADAGRPLLANVSDGQYWLHVVAIDRAGNRGPMPIAGAPGPARVLVDTVHPVLNVTTENDRARLFREGETVVLQPIVFDQFASEFPVSARISTDGGQNYETLRAYHPSGVELPVKLPYTAGLHYVEITASDLAGNRTREVLTFQVIPTPPSVRLIRDPVGSVYVSGRELRFEWESSGVDPLHDGATLEWTTDGENWSILATNQPADGLFTVQLPKVDSNRCRLRVTVTRPDGLVGRAWTGNFTVSSTTPEVEVQEIRPVPSEDLRPVRPKGADEPEKGR